LQHTLSSTANKTKQGKNEPTDVTFYTSATIKAMKIEK